MSNGAEEWVWLFILRLVLKDVISAWIMCSTEGAILCRVKQPAVKLPASASKRKHVLPDVCEVMHPALQDPKRKALYDLWLPCLDMFYPLLVVWVLVLNCVKEAQSGPSRPHQSCVHIDPRLLDAQAPTHTRAGMKQRMRGYQLICSIAAQLPPGTWVCLTVHKMYDLVVVAPTDPAWYPPDGSTYVLNPAVLEPVNPDEEELECYCRCGYPELIQLVMPTPSPALWLGHWLTKQEHILSKEYACQLQLPIKRVVWYVDRGVLVVLVKWSASMLLNAEA
ncbi:hypothetical protein B0H14DRAFT_2562524 [Mycena olivaceomarginata]|nr:hypothetical protein B0H14DRAFT_2562524 [Mycena olivaceomarginata]